jgi:hypothetical protein
MIARRMADGRSPGYRFDATQALRQVLARAVVWGMIDANPARLGVDNPSPRRREQRPFESWAEIDAVVVRTRHVARTVIDVAARSTLRRQDAGACDQCDEGGEHRC